MTSGNTANTVTLTGVSPSGGSIVVDVQALDAAGDQTEYGYLGVLDIEEIVTAPLSPETTRLYLDINGTDAGHGVSSDNPVVWDTTSAMWSPEVYRGQVVNFDHDFTAPTRAWLDGSYIALSGGTPMSTPPVTLKLAQDVSVREIEYYEGGDYRFENNGGDPVTLTLLDNSSFDPGEYCTTFIADSVQLLGDFHFNESRAGTIVLESSATALPYEGTVTFYQGMLVAGENRTSADTHLVFAAGSHTSSFELEASSVTIGSLSGGNTLSDTVKPTNDAPALNTLAINQTVDTSYTGDIKDSTVGGKQLALEKAGTGTLTLTGYLSFTGGTVVSGGTLHAPGNIGNGDVTVQDGGTLLFRAQEPSQIQGDLHLDNQAVLQADLVSGTSPANVQGDLVVGSGVVLQVSSGGTAPADGVYPLLTFQGALTAGFADVQVAGGKYGALSVDGGTLSVTISTDPIQTYDAWVGRYLLSGVNAEDLADPDDDGINNLLEYAFALHPNEQNPSGQGLPTGGVREEEGTLYQILRFRRKRNAPDLTFQFQASEDLRDLENWQTLTVEPGNLTIVDPDADGDGEAEIVEGARDGAGKNHAVFKGGCGAGVKGFGPFRATHLCAYRFGSDAPSIQSEGMMTSTGCSGMPKRRARINWSISSMHFSPSNTVLSHIPAKEPSVT